MEENFAPDLHFLYSCPIVILEINIWLKVGHDKIIHVLNLHSLAVLSVSQDKVHQTVTESPLRCRSGNQDEGEVPDIINALITKYSQSRAPIVAPLYQGQRGSPVLFDRSLLGELMTVEGDKGGREIIEKYKSLMASVSFESPLVGADVDTWEDYQTLRRLLEAGGKES